MATRGGVDARTGAVAARLKVPVFDTFGWFFILGTILVHRCGILNIEGLPQQIRAALVVQLDFGAAVHRAGVLGLVRGQVATCLTLDIIFDLLRKMG